MLKLHILFLVRCWYRSSTFKNSRAPTGPLIPTSGFAARAEKKISESWEICRCWTDAEQNISQVDAKNDFPIPNLFTKFPIRSEDQCVRCLGCQSWNMMEYVGINGTRATAGDEMCPGITLDNLWNSLGMPWTIWTHRSHRFLRTTPLWNGLTFSSPFKWMISEPYKMPAFGEFIASPHVWHGNRQGGPTQLAHFCLLVRIFLAEETGHFWRKHQETIKGMFIDLVDLEGEYLQEHQGFLACRHIYIYVYTLGFQSIFPSRITTSRSNSTHQQVNEYKFWHELAVKTGEMILLHTFWLVLMDASCFFPPQQPGTFIVCIEKLTAPLILQHLTGSWNGLDLGSFICPGWHRFHIDEWQYVYNRVHIQYICTIYSTSASARICKKLWDCIEFISGWWFQPLWKILVRLDHHSQLVGKSYNSCSINPH